MYEEEWMVDEDTREGEETVIPASLVIYLALK